MWRKSPSSSNSVALRCPACGARFGPEERFCPRCAMPLVIAAPPVPRDDARRLRARQVRPEYARGELVRVAGARHQAEAEMLQLILLEEGVPSVLRRSAGFDVPDFLAAGPRDVLVPEGGAAAARELLGTAPLGPPERRETRGAGHAARLVLAIGGGGLLAAALAWALLGLA